MLYLRSTVRFILLFFFVVKLKPLHLEGVRDLSPSSSSNFVVPMARVPGQVEHDAVLEEDEERVAEVIMDRLN
jgi:hypothetical protein